MPGLTRYGSVTTRRAAAALRRKTEAREQARRTESWQRMKEQIAAKHARLAEGTTA